MQFSFTNEIDDSLVRSLLARHGVSKRLLSKVKFEDEGHILVNGTEQNAIYRLKIGDIVSIIVPDEPDNEFLIPEELPLEILFEDEHYLVVNKPAGVPSITGLVNPTGAMSNAVKGYILRQNYENQAVHIITRLDKNTSGIMFFAKHRYAHALMSPGSKYRDSLEKRYFALVSVEKQSNEIIKNEPSKLSEIGEINLPIGRCDDSIIKREVRYDEKSKTARTSYKIVKEKNGLNLLDITLHTGRTHQIRVHFAHIGFSLIGDDLYGGNHDLIDRQALHCHHLQFLHPFTNEMVEIELDLPEDMKNLLK